MSGIFSKRPNTPGYIKHWKLPLLPDNNFHHFLVIVFPYIFIFPSLLFPGILNVLNQSEKEGRKVQIGHHQNILANCYWHTLIELLYLVVHLNDIKTLCSFLFSVLFLCLISSCVERTHSHILNVFPRVFSNTPGIKINFSTHQMPQCNGGIRGENCIFFHRPASSRFYVRLSKLQ